MIDIDTLIHRNLGGTPTGLPCFCTANEHVLRAIVTFAATHQVPAVIEATCNQVNQDGGYTGMSAQDFADWIKQLSLEAGVANDNILLGGDHLGPNPWRHLPVSTAMGNAEVLVRDYAAAGFRKIHLDASMACGGETTPSFEEVAERAARLCQVAESHSPKPDELIYIIGTEVPVPGGETDEMDELAVTSVDHFNKTIDTHRESFERHGLSGAWPKVASIVVQPGVDFSHTAVHRFQPDDAVALAKAISMHSGITYEAHSTDYQPTDALAEIVAKHFFFLKVGPELTFRLREAVFALAHIENHLLENNRSGIIDVVDQAMDDNPADWTQYYRGDPQFVSQLRHFSYSDRIRYYWPAASVKLALDRLIFNLENLQLPETLVSQYFPARAFGALDTTPRQLVSDHVGLCIQRYYAACGFRL